MTTLSNVMEGTTIRVNNTNVYAKVLKQGPGSITVETDQGRTYWSPYTVVTVVDDKPVPILEPVKKPVPESEPAIKTAPTAPVSTIKARKRKPGKTPVPKPKAENRAAAQSKEYDVFGVRIGTQAHRINLLLLQVKKNATVDMIAKLDSSINKGSILSHLSRMACDGLIHVEKREKVRYYSIIAKKKS